MSVTCERPLDGVSAAQKLNSQSFDLVLVDCENLPAAKLIFDVCRRGKNGNNPVPIAIVDGRAGLPTAFRLGAELILTKPVAKDQARGTIRTAVSRVRKAVPANESSTAQPATAAMTGTAISSPALPEEHTQAAAAAAVSSQLTSFAEPAPSFVSSSLASAAPTAVADAASTATLAAPAVTTKMHSAVDEIDAPTTTPQPIPVAPAETKSKSMLPLVPSDDPVLAELERVELEESQAAKAAKPEAQKPSTGLEKAASEPVPSKSNAQRSLSYPQGSRKTRGPLIALLMLAVAGGGFYAAWTYQPAFRAVVQPIVQPEIDRVLGLVGIATTPAPSPAKPAARVAPAPTPAPAPPSRKDPNQAPATPADSAINSAAAPTNGSATTSNAAAVPGKPLAANTIANPAVAKPGSAIATTTISSKPVTAKPSDIALGDKKLGDKKNDAAATSSGAPLPGENTAVILSSKGAENRLLHSVPPKYPADAHADGTVLLKAVIDETGKVEGLRLIEGNATLATAAMQAVKQWRYRPYVRDGKTQIFQTVVIVDFQKP
ncbi:MAG: TonB family protein [Terriglobales bacterium]